METDREPTLNFREWKNIREAAERVERSQATRIDGEGWKVYAVGPMVRIDIPTNHQEEGE